MSAAHPWTPPTLRGVPADAIGVWNALAGRTGVPLPLRGQAAAVVELAEAPPVDALCLDLRLGPDLPLVLRPVAFPFMAAFGADLDVADLPLLPDALREALLAGLVAAFASVMPDHDLGALTTRAAGPLGDLVPAERAEDLRWFRVALHGLAPAQVALDIAASLDTLARIFGPLGPRPVWPGIRQILTRTAAVTLGRLVLPLGDLRALAPGSVVVLDAGIGPGSARLRLGPALFHFREAGGGWTCSAVTAAAALPDRPDETRQEGPTSMSSSMSSSTSSSTLVPTAEPRGADLDAGLDVALDLDIGSVTVPLAEIETWQVGSLVALDPEIPRDGLEVVLRVNGRAVGAGELVRIDDRFAVRLVRLALG